MGRLHLSRDQGSETAVLARLAMESPVVARGGDRLVLRSFSPVTTIGGGTVVDPSPPRRGAGWSPLLAASSPVDRLPALVGRRRDGAPIEDLPLLLGVPPREVGGIVEAAAGLAEVGGRLVAASTLRTLEAAALALVDAWHRDHPAEPGAPIETIRKELSRTAAPAMTAIETLVSQGKLARRDALIHRAGWQPVTGASAAEVDRLVKVIETAGLTPPSLAELESPGGHRDLRALLKSPVAEGRLVAVAPDRYFAPGPLREFVSALAAIGSTGAITPTALRERLGLSRKFLIPLLKWADRQGLTRRTGESRVLVKLP